MSMKGILYLCNITKKQQQSNHEKTHFIILGTDDVPMFRPSGRGVVNRLQGHGAPHERSGPRGLPASRG